MLRYIAAVHKDKDSDLGISFPDFPGCITTADDMKEAKFNAQEVLDFHITGLLENGGDLPKPTPLNEIQKMDEYSDASYFEIEVDTTPAGEVKTSFNTASPS
jgi:predicted RNase H-like HicB family nuclease